MVEDDEELLLVESRFRALVIEWDLGRGDVGALLGVTEAELGLDLVPLRRSSLQEARLRMLVEIRDMLRAGVADERDVPLRIRCADWDDDADEPGVHGSSLLQFLKGSEVHLRAARDALRHQSGGGWT